METRNTSQEYIYLNSAEEAQTYLNSLEGQVIRPGSKVTPLLPPVEEFIKLIGFQASVPVLMELLSGYSHQRLPVSRATLFKLPSYLLGKLKLSKTSLRKLITFTFSCLAEKAPTVKLRIPLTYTGGVADGWDGLLLAFKHSDELFFLIEFIEKRMRVEHELLSFIVNPSTSCPDKYQAYLDALKSNMRIPDDAYEHLRASFNKQEKDQQSLEQECLWVCSSKLDFYFSAIACFEIGWLQRIAKEQPEILHTRTSWFKKGIISTFIKSLRIEKQEIMETPFERYLDWLAEESGTSATDGSISHAKLASFIPLESEEDTSEGYTKAEKQKDLLKDWKKSKYPSPQKFVCFIQNLRGGQTADAVFLADIGLAAIMLDKLFLELFHQLNVYSSPACQKTLEQCIKRYQDYFLHYQTTLPDVVPAAA